MNDIQHCPPTFKHSCTHTPTHRQTHMIIGTHMHTLTQKKINTDWGSILSNMGESQKPQEKRIHKSMLRN